MGNGSNEESHPVRDGRQIVTEGVQSEDGVHKYQDPRVTTVGRWLRRTSIDELPQLINVLRGEMSLVGPRPVLDWELELFELPAHQRFAVQPGITGHWQV